MIYCIISLSKRDPRFTSETMQGVKAWLSVEKRAGNPYLFHDVHPIKVTKGSKLLFSFQARLFGMATAKTDIEDVQEIIQDTMGEYVYQYSMVLDPSSISLFPREVPKKEIKRLLKINCDRPFRYLKKAQYDRILGMGGLSTQR